MPICCRLRPAVIAGVLAAVALGIALAPPSRGEGGTVAAPRDWPMYGGTPSRNMVNTVEKNLPVEWSIEKGKQKNIKWAVPLGRFSYGGPTIAEGRIFVGTNNDRPRNPKIEGDKGIVWCLEAATGKFLWQAVHDKLGSQEMDFPEQGVGSTPAVAGGRVYYVSNRCELVCVDVNGNGAEAKTLWKLDMIKELGVYPRFLAQSSPLVAGDLVFVVTANGVTEDDGKFTVPVPKAPSFVAVDKNTGQVKWKDNSPGDKIMEGQWTSPAYAEVGGKGQVIFPGGDGWLRGFEATTGKLLWQFDCNPKKSEYKPSGRGDKGYFLATPVMYDNKVYVGVGLNPEDGPGVGHLWCIDITKTGDLSPVKDNFDPKDPVNKNSGLVWHLGGKTPEGSEREFYFGRTLSTCAIHDGLLYVADLDGFFYCVDAKTGEVYWVHDLKQSVWGSPMWADGKVYMGDEGGNVHVFEHGKKAKLLAKNSMRKGIKTAPVAVNGVLYIMTDDHLYAIANK